MQTKQLRRRANKLWCFEVKGALKIREAEARVEDEVKMAEARLDVNIKDLPIRYNANVLKRRNLAWLDNYPTHLYNAWGRLVEDENAEHQAKSIDEFELENRALNEDERKVLHDSMIAYEKEKFSTQHSEAREGSGVEHHDGGSEILAQLSLNLHLRLIPSLCLHIITINCSCLQSASKFLKLLRHLRVKLRKVF